MRKAGAAVAACVLGGWLCWLLWVDGWVGLAQIQDLCCEWDWEAPVWWQGMALLGSPDAAMQVGAAMQGVDEPRQRHMRVCCGRDVRVRDDGTRGGDGTPGAWMKAALPRRAHLDEGSRAERICRAERIWSVGNTVHVELPPPLAQGPSPSLAMGRPITPYIR